MNSAAAVSMTPGADKRRSQRLLLSVPVLVRGHSNKRVSFEEASHTLVVNAHGGLITLGTPLERGQRILLLHRATEEEIECAVVFLGPTHASKAQVGFEFARAAPHFWRVSFPPLDWQPIV